MQKFGVKVRQLRRQNGITLETLAHDLGYSDHTFLSRIERGQKKPSTELVIAIARKFDVPIDMLLLDNLEIEAKPNEGS